EPPLEIAALLGGHGHERHAAREVLEGARFEKADRRADEPRDLGVVAARVCGARHWVRLRVSGDPEGVELSDEGESRPGPGAAGDVRANARQSEAGSRDEAEATELFRDECRGLQLLEAELGMAPDGLADTDDLVGVALDGLADTLLQLVPGHGRCSPRFLGAPRPAEPQPRDGLQRAYPRPFVGSGVG